VHGRSRTGSGAPFSRGGVTIPIDPGTTDDPYDLSRFLHAQATDYERALSEIAAGRKRSHWMWYIFPQIDGLASSSTSKRYSIKSIHEVRAYLDHPVLGSRLLECATAVVRVQGRTASEIFGSPDDLKLKSCATLFAFVLPPGSVFDQLLEQYYGGERDDRTLALVGVEGQAHGTMPACQEALHLGWTIPDASGRPILYRYLAPSDSVEAITALLHEAYGPLAESGMRFLATHQDAEVTRRRMDRGETIVATDAGHIIGVITLKSVAATSGTPFYDRPDVASFEQLAVSPSHQGTGVGSTLMTLVERRAAELGAAELALDTSEDAKRLIALYQARGYRFVETCQWDVTNYRSVVMALRLGAKSAP